jgi:hypothetical protein
MHRYLLVILFALASCSGRERSVECNGVDEPSNAQKGFAADPLMAEIASIVGPGVTSCGRVPLGQDPMKAWQCAEDADRRGAAHWFASLRTESGQKFILSYDSNYMGGPGLQPSFTKYVCNGRIGFSPDLSQPLHCVRPQSL